MYIYIYIYYIYIYVYIHLWAYVLTVGGFGNIWDRAVAILPRFDQFWY